VLVGRVHAELALSPMPDVVARAGGWTSALGPVLEPVSAAAVLPRSPSSPVEASSRLDGRRRAPGGGESEVEAGGCRARGGRTPEGTLVVALGRPRSAAPASPTAFATCWRGRRGLVWQPRGMVSALVLGGRGGITPTCRIASGRADWCTCSRSRVSRRPDHGWVYLLARLCGSAGAGAGGRAVVGAAYVAFLGWPPPAARQRRSPARRPLSHRPAAGPPDALLAATCLGVLLLDPGPSSISADGFPPPRSGVPRDSPGGATTRSGQLLVPNRSVVAGSDSGHGAAHGRKPGTVAPIGVGLNFLAIPIAAVAVPACSQPAAVPVWHGAAEGLAAVRALSAPSGALAVAGAAVPGGTW
jgi:hypothetical protein